MLKVTGKEKQAAQKDLARLILEPKFQETFNIEQGFYSYTFEACS